MLEILRLSALSYQATSKNLLHARTVAFATCLLTTHSSGKEAKEKQLIARMPLKQLRRGQKQPITLKWVPASPDGEIGTTPKRDQNNNVPRINEEIVFPPRTPEILKDTASPHPAGQQEAKVKHIAGFILRPWVLHRIELEPPRLTRPLKFFLRRPYDQRVWRVTTPN
ncbi:hypothetical protein PUN28_013990 [Cardiocondyla obscurior]|uniref:Uncharacterized protein n=1 Tax=Cardiocondyla obscurior TaxID=286306 RepID=A0AAW2F665_9HYME